jgi:hypothetical protein
MNWAGVPSRPIRPAAGATNSRRNASGYKHHRIGGFDVETDFHEGGGYQNRAEATSEGHGGRFFALLVHRPMHHRHLVWEEFLYLAAV